MTDLQLFQKADGAWISSSQILSLLEAIRAPKASVLYIHTGITFGAPNPHISRGELLDHLYQLFLSMGVPTLCFPTFTFSFCNGQDFHVQSSCTRMGALNEHVRKQPGAIRSIDPLMSTIVIGEDHELVTGIGKHSIGRNSTFDRLHGRGSGVKFLFFGTTVSECFTYTHYVEEQLSVPYRYNRSFTGTIEDGGRSWQDKYQLFVRFHGIVPSGDGKLEKDLLQRGLLRKVQCGCSSLACLDEPDGYQTIVDHLQENPDCYITGNTLDRSAEFAVRGMVSL